MKTSIKTLISAALCAIILSSSVAVPTFAAEPIASSRRISASKFKKIVVRGNVDLLLVQNSKSGVIINEDARGAKLRVTQQGETLKIVSNQIERIQVTVYINDIYRIDASENAEVKTFSELKLKYLQVFLHDNAVADIHASTESLYTVVADKARLSLSGYSDHHALVMSRIAKLSLDDFSAIKSEVSYSDAVAMLNNSVNNIK
jgi:hypothetical protein